MKYSVLFLLCICITGILPAQEYKVQTDRKDAFSTALVKLLNEAPSRFENCKGPLIRRTSLMGDDYELTIPFPGSTGAVVRYRDWDKNVYIEFRDPANKKTIHQLVKELQGKIEHALGDQLSGMHQRMSDTSNYFGLYLKDKNGFFAMNMEVMGSSSAEPIYLLGPEREEAKAPKQNLVLLKVYGGTPAYMHSIPEMKPPEDEIHAILQKLLTEAATDFKNMRNAGPDSPFKKRRRTDTLQIGERTVYMNYAGSNYSASLVFAAHTDPSALNRQQEVLQEMIMAATGTGYVYNVSSLQEELFISYFKYGQEMPSPVIYLTKKDPGNGEAFFTITVQSGYSHPTKRSLDRDELRE